MKKVKRKFCCIQCNYFSDYNGNLKQHFKTKKHTEMIGKEKPVLESLKCEQIKPEFKCINFNCLKRYKTQSGLWKHAQICRVVPVLTCQILLTCQMKLKN